MFSTFSFALTLRLYSASSVNVLFGYVQHFTSLSSSESIHIVIIIDGVSYGYQPNEPNIANINQPAVPKCMPCFHGS
eukprot:g48941.t1